MKSDLYDKSFFEKRQKHRSWQSQAGYVLAQYFEITSVIDYGCGLGSFLEGFLRYGSGVGGYEVHLEQAHEFIPETIAPYIFPIDVTEMIRNPLRSDCSFSVEVAEHIEPQTSETFAENLCANSSRLVIMSAAPLGQGGVGHINCRPYEYWKDLMIRYGFKFSPKNTDLARRLLREVDGVASWIHRNLMIFEAL